MELRNAAAALALSALAACTPGTEKTLYVAPERRPCTGVAPMECLQVRDAPDRPWQNFYSEIEGFTHEPGYRYELRVREDRGANPPADGSSLRWTLVKVVSKQAGSAPEKP